MQKIKKIIHSCLFSFVLVPVSDPSVFLDLKYKKIKPNIVNIEKEISIDVQSSASPLFVKLPEVKALKEISIKGSTEIKKEITNFQDDAYFQVGIIYKGRYRPGSFVRRFLPEWLLTVLNLNRKHGVGRIDFHSVSMRGQEINKTSKIRDIRMKFKTAAYFNDKNEFELVITPRQEEVLGIWLRADGDQSRAQFKTHLSNIEIID